MSWIDQVVKATKETESPERYWYWSSLATISAIVKRNIYLNRGGKYLLYPNLYVLLIGPSGVRKGPPITLARKLVSEVKATRVIAGRGSIQAYIKELSSAYHMADGSILTEACGFLVSGELGAFLVEDPAAYTILTDLYDACFYNEWKNYIKGTGVDTLKGVYLTMLGASNESLLHTTIPKNVIGGGFVGRSMVVVEEKKRGVNSLIYSSNGNLDYTELSKHLYELTKLEGGFKFTDDAAKFADDWYTKYNIRQEKLKHRDKLGLSERIFEHILKVAMLISLSKKFDLILDESDIQESVLVCQECIAGTKRVFMNEGQSETSGPTRIVIQELLKRKDCCMSRARLLSVGWGDFDSIMLDRVITTLSEMGHIESFRQGKQIMYKLLPHVIEGYQSFKVK